MSLAKLFIARNHAKQCRLLRMRYLRRCKALPRRNPLLFEPLEARLLLSATLQEPLVPGAAMSLQPVQSEEPAANQSSSPAFAIIAPSNGAFVSPGVVPVEFATQNFILADQGEPHLNFYLDTDPTPYMFFNGATREVLYAGAHTHLVHWDSESSIEFHGLPTGPHDVRFVLADAMGQELTNPEATQSLSLTVAEPPQADFQLEPVFTGLDFPVSFAFARDGRVFYNEFLTGRIRVIESDGQVNASPFKQLNVYQSGEAGLLGLALDPDFANNHYVYAYHSYRDGGTGPIRNRVVRLTDNNGVGENETVLLNAVPGASIHNGGILGFGPDGMLYVTVGDGNVSANAQSAVSLSGKVLRINKDGTIPSDNPFPGSKVYALGLRNSFGLTFHPHTGDLWLTENGPSVDDEVNRIVPGGNYGWPTVTGIANNTAFIDPLLEFTPTIAPTGIVAISDASAYPAEYHDNLLFADYNGGRVRRVVLAGPDWTDLGSLEVIYAGGIGSLLDLEEGLDGFVYASTTQGIYRLTLAPSAQIQITNVQIANVTETTVTIAWTTDIAADSQVEYGLTTNYGLLTAPDPTPTTAHSVIVGGLQPDTTYQFRVRSREAGGPAVASGDFVVTTLAVPRAGLEGLTFEDLDGDGARDEGEPVLAGWTIFLDADANGQLDPGERFTVTGQDGTYAFAGLPPGDYLIEEVRQPGWMQTFPRLQGNAGIVELTTTGASVPLFTPAEVVLAESATLSVEGTGPAEVLTNLATLRSDPRFSGVDGRGLTAVVIDTGMDLDHPFFGPDTNGDRIADRIVYQFDFADSDADASDRSGHGSHVASVIGSQDATFPGVAPGANLIALKIFHDSGDGSFADLEEALQWVVANAATYDVAVINLSLGDGGNWAEPQTHYGLGDELAALAGQDILVLAAAGNNFGSFNSWPGVAYPGADPNALAVGAVWSANFGGPWTFKSGATDFTTGPDRIASFSQRHPSLLDVFAPGASVTGANQLGRTITMQGTSQAAAFLSGTAVLAQQLAEQELGRRLTQAEFTALVATTSDPIVDGDDENDSVTNTGLTFPRIGVLRLAEGILALAAQGDGGGTAPGPGPLISTTSPLGGYQVSLAAGQMITGLDFGNFRLGETRGTKFQDLDLDGGQDPGEPGLAGWTIYLDGNANQQLDAGERVATTDASGAYRFTEVGPGLQTVREVPQTSWLQTAPLDGFHAVTMTSGLVADAKDFGNLRLTLDVDGDGAATASTDGKVILRYLSGYPDSQLLTGVTLGTGATRTTPTVIRRYLDAGKTLPPAMLDADGDGTCGALTDGRLIYRYLSGITGPALIGGSVLGAGATRTTPEAIVDYSDDFLPAVPTSADSADLTFESLSVTEIPTLPLAPAPSSPSQPLGFDESRELSAFRPGSLLAGVADPEGSPAGQFRSIPSAIFSGAYRFTSRVSDGEAEVEARKDPLLGGLGYDVPSNRDDDDLRLGDRGRDLFIDWSRPWEGWGHGHQRGQGLKSAWLKPFLLDLTADPNPNLGIEVVLADPDPAYAPANRRNGHGHGKNPDRNALQTFEGFNNADGPSTPGIV